MASSLVGVSIRAYKGFLTSSEVSSSSSDSLAVLSDCLLEISHIIPDKIGRPKAKVFPLPVSAAPRISLFPEIAI